MSINDYIRAMSEEVRCLKCGKTLYEDKGLTASAILDLKVPGVGWHRRGSLCGSCNINLLGYLFPELADSPDMIAIREKISQGKSVADWTAEGAYDRTGPLIPPPA